MRDSLIILLLLTGCLLDSSAQHTSVSSLKCITEAKWNNLPSHPRLFANDVKIAAIKKQKDDFSIKLLKILKNNAEQYLKATNIVYPGGISTFGASRNVQGRILSLALNYRLTGDKRSLEKARGELMQLAELKNWGTGFLEIAEAALAAGVGYDWLYHQLTREERNKIATAIKEKAIIPALEVKEGPNSWLNGNYNWNPVCNGGVMVGALAIAETEPELARQITERSIKYIPFAGEAYAVDGALPEGPSYWAYGTTFYVIATEALRTVFGTTCDLEKMPGFLKTADFNVQMVAPSGEDFNFSDYHIELLNEPSMPCFARELKRPDLMKEELTDINRYHEVMLTGKNAKPGKQVHLDRITPLELLWWDPSLLQITSPQKTPLHWSPKGELSMGVMRSSWGDPKVSYIAIKGGTPNNSHGHMDAGSFIMEADGVRWALDLGTESYGKMREAKLDLWNYTQNSNRWTTFRAGPEGHNILRFNNELQLIHGKAEVEAIPNNKGTVGNKADLTSLYANYAKQVYRTVQLHPDRSLSIKDEWVTKNKAAEVTFQWLTKATVTKKSYGLLLQQNGESLQLKIDPTLLKKVIIEVQDVSKSKATQDSDNPGLSRILIKTKTAANTAGRIALRAYPGSVLKSK